MNGQAVSDSFCFKRMDFLSTGKNEIAEEMPEKTLQRKSVDELT